MWCMAGGQIYLCMCVLTLCLYGFKINEKREGGCLASFFFN